MKILALVGDLAVPCGHGLPFDLAVAPATLRPLQPMLRCSQPIPGAMSPSRIIDTGAGAESGETDNADIDTGLLAGPGQRAGRHFVTREHQRPAPARSFDLNRLPTAHALGDVREP